MSSTPSTPDPSAPDETSAVPAESPTAPTATDSAPTAPTGPAGAVAEPADDVPVEIPAEGPLSDEQIAAIAASAQPATIRRAPRYGAFFWTGALVGIVLGVVFGLGLSYDGMVNRWIYVLVTVLGTTLVTVLLAGACAVVVDRRGAARAAKQRGRSSDG